MLKSAHEMEVSKMIDKFMMELAAPASKHTATGCCHIVDLQLVVLWTVSLQKLIMWVYFVLRKFCTVVTCNSCCLCQKGTEIVGITQSEKCAHYCNLNG